MVRWLWFLLPVLLILAASCTQKMVCPAYQSAFIYDKNELRKRFSYFNEDSTPKVLTASKNKYLIADPVPYKKKVRQMATVQARPMNPVVPDSLQEGSEVTKAELDAAARSVIDSVYIPNTAPVADTAIAEPEPYVITKDREVRVLKYNFPDSLKFDTQTGKYVPEKPKYYVVHIGYDIDQDNYMWYLRDVLVLPDVRLARQQAEETAKKEARKSKGIRGFFNKLFKKKKKEKAKDTMQEDQKPRPRTEEEEYQINFDEPDQPRDSAAATPPSVPAAPSKKKSPFSFLKRKSKQPDQPSNRQLQRKEEDDGF
ncbi:MAG: hypothetical protein N2044_04105 [Cyclobacteriaceae bacterium]|nr:hypothetical protein [Cyclobacteriaceae bacterium]MCX7637011.1 hypothetical protein [Cyclobacteriaceae bacterium]MDW8330134.1 hypothetical protein [Cyclobacteriaceae bacterium]